jgi:hypothetical protein
MMVVTIVTQDNDGLYHNQHPKDIFSFFTINIFKCLHYEKSHPSKPHCRAPKIKKEFIYNYLLGIIMVVFKFTPFLVKFTPFACPILCRLTLRVCSFISSITSAGKFSSCAMIDHRPHTCIARTIYRGVGQTHSNLIYI